MNGMVDSPDALGDDPCTVTGIRAIDEPGERLVEVEITVGCSSAAACGRTGRAGIPGSGSSVVGCVLSETMARWGPPRRDGSGWRSRELSLRTSSGVFGKRRGTLTRNIRLCWSGGEGGPGGTRRVDARGRPTLARRALTSPQVRDILRAEDGQYWSRKSCDRIPDRRHRHRGSFLRHAWPLIGGAPHLHIDVTTTSIRAAY